MADKSDRWFDQQPDLNASGDGDAFDQFWSRQENREREAARDTLATGMGAGSPDEVGQAMKLAPEVGLPAQAVATDLPWFKQEVDMTRAARKIDENQWIARWLAGDAERAKIAIDDFDNLDLVSKSFRALGSGWEEGVLTNARGRAQAEQSVFGSDRRAELSAYDKRLARNPALRGVYGVLSAGAGFAGGILDSLVRASDEAVFGAGVGAIAGAAATAPAGGVGAVPGAITGFGVGFTQGFFVDQSLVAAGMTYQALENAVDDGGRPVDPVAKHTAAAGVFLASYGLNYVGGELLWSSATKALQSVAVEAVKKPTVGRALATFGKELAKGGVEGAALMGAFAGVQIFAENFAKQYSSDDFATIFNDSEARARAADQLVQAMTMGAAFMPFAKLPFEAKSLANDLVRVRQAQMDAAVMQSLGETAGASKVRERSMDAFQAFAREHLEGGPIQEVGVPVEAVLELYQSLKIEPGADDGVLGTIASDIKRQIEQAKETGGDIRLNLDAYTAKLAGSDVWNALAPNIRFRAEGMTLREAEAYSKLKGQLLEDASPEFAATRDKAMASEEAADRVYEDVFSKLRRAGYTLDAATQVARLWSSRYRARAERLGGEEDAFDLYDAENIEIRRELPPTVRKVGIDRTDMLIEAIRRGEKLPSDRRIYGPTVLEFIKKRGGVFDYGGELKARDLNKMRGLVRSAKKGGDKESYGMDGTMRALWEAGYFPEFSERPEINDLLAAIDEELAGNKRYQYGTDREAEALFKKAVEELDDFMRENSIDPAKMTNAKIKKMIAAKDPSIERGRVLEQGDVNTSDKRFKKWFGKSKVVDEDGKPLRVFHGTTADFDAFDLAKANPESDWGAGFYFTNEAEDVGYNYAGRGPDLKSKIEREAERIAAETDRQYDDPDVRAEAEAKFIAHEGATIPVYLSIKKPFIVGGRDETILDYKQTRTGKESGKLTDFIMAVQRARDGGEWHNISDTEYGQFVSKVFESLEGDEGIGAQSLVEIVKSKLAYVEDANGNMAVSEFIRQVLEEIGFDGVIDHSVNQKFGSEREIGKPMEGMNEDTVHYIAFKPSQIKSVFNSGKWATQDNRILYQGSRERNAETTVLEQLAEGEAVEAGFERIKAKHPNAKLIPSTGVEPGGVQYVRAKVRIADLPKKDQPGAWREFNQPAYHGSPHVFDKFTLDHIGKGEGAQAYGWGLYFAGDKSVAKFYREKLTRSAKVFIDGNRIEPAEPSNHIAVAEQTILNFRGDVDGAAKYAAEYSNRLNGGAAENSMFADKPKEWFAEQSKLWADAGKWIEENKSRVTYERDEGRLYKVELSPTADEMLDWDAKVDKQPAAVKKIAYELAAANGHAKSKAGFLAWKMEAGGMSEAHGEFIYRKLSEHLAEKTEPVDPPGAPRGWAAVRMTVNDRYANDRAASLRLLAEGVRAIRYLDGNSRGKGKGSRNFVIFDDADITIKEYEQQRGPKDVRRGSIRLEDGASIITLFKDSDLSTILHESGHQWLEELRRDYLDVTARAPDAAGEMGGGESVRGDFEAVMKWLGMDSPADISVEQHEKFARGFEAYLMEGKAPSSALARAFRAFKQWLVRIYRDIAGLNVELSDDVRRVFDRMLATEDELASVQQDLAANPAFASAKDAGMTDAEFAAYTKQLDLAQKSADEKLLNKTMAAVRSAREKEWKDQYKEMRAETKASITARPDLRAEHWLRTGKMIDGTAPEGLEHLRLSQKYLADMYGHKGMLDMLPERVTSKDGAHPDTVAVIFGYNTGDDLVQALMTLEGMRKAEAALTGKSMAGDRYVNHLIDRETTERMLDRHGDALNDGSIEQEAIDAIHNSARLEVLGTELKAIGKRIGKTPVAIDDMRAWVDEQIAAMPVMRARSETGFVRAEGSAGREVQRSLLKGDFRNAFIHKQRQIINSLFVRAAKDAAKDYTATMKMLTRYAKKAEHKSLDPDYVNQIHALLKRIGFQVRRQDAELAAGLEGTTLREFVDGKRSDGHELLAAEYLLDPMWEKPVVDMTMGELRDVSDFMKSMIHAARFERQVRVDGKLQEFEAIKEEMKETLAKRPQLKDATVKDGVAIRSPGVGKGGVKDRARAALFRFKSTLSELDSNLRKTEELCDILDGDDSDGVFNRVIFKPIAEREHWAADKQRAITTRWIALRDGMSAAWRQSIDSSRVVVPELRRVSGEPWAFSKGELIMIAANLGSKSNMAKMLKGEFWEEAAVRSALDRLLTKEDWNFVQSTLDIVNSLWPEIDAQERRLTGVGPDKVEAIPIQTKYGTLKGGYFPMMYDASLSLDTSMRVASAEGKLFDMDYQRATTPRGHTKRRVEGYARELDYNFGRVAHHLESVIHDLAYREALMQADRVLRDKDIRGGIAGVIGSDAYKQLHPWLKSIANSTAIDLRNLTAFDWACKTVRINATMVGLGFRVKTMLAQLSGFGDSAEMIGGKGVAKGIASAYGAGSPLEALSKGIRLVSETKAGKLVGAEYMARGFDAITGSQRKFEQARGFVVERSGEVRNRFLTIDRDMRQGMKELIGKTGIINEARRFAYHGIALMDQAVVVPTWIGAYKKAIAEGKAEDKAIYYADKVVRLSQGSGSAKDLSPVHRQSQPEWFKLTTMFYTYFSHFYNRLARIGEKAKSGVKQARAGNWKGARKDFAASFARFFWLCVVPPLTAKLITGGGPEEGEDVGGWALRTMTFNMFGGVPIVRDMASAYEYHFVSGQAPEYKFSPAERMGTLLLKNITNISAALDGEKDVGDKWLKEAIETAGYVGGLPGAGQLGTSSQYVLDIAQGDRNPETATQFVGELLLGPKPKEK